MKVRRIQAEVEKKREAYVQRVRATSKPSGSDRTLFSKKLCS